MGWEKGDTFGGITRLVLPEPREVLVFEPGDVGVVVFVVFLTRPFRHLCVWWFPLLLGLRYQGVELSRMMD